MNNRTGNIICLSALIIVIFFFCALASLAHGQTTQPAPPLPAQPSTNTTLLLSTSVNLATQSWRTQTKSVLPAGTISYGGIGIALPSDTDLGGAKNSDGSNATTIVFTAAHPVSDHLFTTNGARVRIHDIDLRTNAAVLIAAGGSDITIQNVNVSGGQLWISRTVNRLHVTGCKAGVLPMYWGYFAWAGAGKNSSSNVTIDHCIVAGSIGGHCIRTEAASHVLISDCELSNPESIVRPTGYVHGQCIKLGGGTDWTMRNCWFDGPIQIGANLQSEPFPPVVDGAVFWNCTEKSGYIQLNPGVTNLYWTRGTVHCDDSGTCFNVRGNSSFPDRPIVQGLFTNFAASYAAGTSGKLFFNDWRGKVKVGPGLTFNGHPVAQW